MSALVRDRVQQCLFGATALMVVFHLSGLGSLDLRARAFWWEQVGLDIGYVLLIRQVSRLPESTTGRDVMRFWRMYYIVATLFLAGDLAQAVASSVQPAADAVGGGTAQSVLVGCGDLLAMWAMLTHPTAIPRRERLRLWLDAAIIMVGSAVFVWYFSLPTDGSPPTTDLLLSIGGAGLMLLAGLGVVKLVLGRNAPFTKLVGTGGALASVLIGLSTGLAAAADTPAELDLTMVARLVPCAALLFVARMQGTQLRLDPELFGRRSHRSYSRSPFVAAGVTQILLVAVLAQHGLGLRVWGVVVGILLMTGLVVARQFAALKENNVLLRELRYQEERFRSMVQYSSDVTLVTDSAGAITYASPAVEHALGIAADRITGRPLSDLVHPEDQAAVVDLLADLAAAPRSTVRASLRLRGANGSWRWLAMISTNLLDDPSVNGIICNARDVTEERRFAERLRFDATHDPLTRLANRALLQERIDRETANRRRAERQVAMLVIDLDDFKPVNDTLGHHVGDALLISVGQRLLRCVRPADTVARLGGDEFAVFLSPATPTHAEAVGRRILESLAEPAVLDGHRLTVRASIGIAVGPGREAADLLRAADVSMYEAKHGGKGTFAIARTAAPDVPAGAHTRAGADVLASADGPVQARV